MVGFVFSGLEWVGLSLEVFSIGGQGELEWVGVYGVSVLLGGENYSRREGMRVLELEF